MTEQTNTQVKTVAADGKTETFTVPGFPIMVSCSDFNKLFYEIYSQSKEKTKQDLSVFFKDSRSKEGYAQQDQLRDVE